MPWKGETDPYRIWLSEIILQQTRVEQGTSYYNKFIAGFPSISQLASAPEKEIFKFWEGLGYYSRCRNLIATAKKIVHEYHGRFPSSYPEILSLPGIGPYTAAAIASFAFGLPYAVVDGNVERVLSRYFGISASSGSAASKKLYAAMAEELLDKKQPGTFNQAIMDFGATICKPKNPFCESCVVSKDCQAFQNEWTDQLPVKIPVASRKKRWLYYFIVRAGKDKFWIRERTGKDIWQNLYEFVLWETGKIIPQEKLLHSPFFREKFGDLGKIEHISPAYHQILSHQAITGYFVHVNCKETLPGLAGYQSVSREKLRDFPFPKLISDYIQKLPTG
jgi:A/G-specific adenine glycosylase